MKRSGLMALALATTALAPFALASHAAAAPVLPTGGKVVAGSASIGSPSGSALTVNQSSGKAIINWSGFSIGQGGTVQFNNGSGATLNRVTGTGLSSIDGLLSGTGSVYLINPNGVIIGKSGVVNVGGTFVASTQDVSNQNFLAGGDLTFSGPSAAAVINYGKVGSLGGDVALIAANVTNTGSIVAPNGDVGLIAGSQVLLKDASLDEGRFTVQVGGAGTSATNSGLIQAADAELRAEGGNVYALAGDTAGVVRATGVSAGGGHIWLVADQGTLSVAGTLEAQRQGSAPGSIETSGGTVDVGQAAINAHGGTWSLDPGQIEITPTAATTISDALATSDVTETTSESGTSETGVTSGATTTTAYPAFGDILLDAGAAISWGSSHTLTLSAQRALYINGTITVTGAGGLTLITQNDDTGATYQIVGVTFGSGASVQFTGVNAGQPLGTLMIGAGANAAGTPNLTTFTLVRDLATLSADIAANNTGAYALATSVDGSNGGLGYTQTPLASTLTTPFAGKLEGLGNAVTNLIITDPVDSYVGLIAQNEGLITNVTISGGAVTGIGNVGALVGANEGSVFATTGEIDRAASSAVVTGAADGSGTVAIGGLVGSNNGFISQSSASGAVTNTDGTQHLNGGTGGLVGVSSSNVASSSASGAVTSLADADTGGLIGYASGGVNSDDSATGEVSGAAQTGGLIGVSAGSTNTLDSFATGTVSGTLAVGGLIGATDSIVHDSYATGDVTGSGVDVGGLVGLLGDALVGPTAVITVSGTAQTTQGGQSADSYVTSSYALGSVTGEAFVGGLVGVAAFSAEIASDSPESTAGPVIPSHATGTVRGVAGANGDGDEVGGLVGALYGGQLIGAYATGAVSGRNAVGGLVGSEAYGDSFNGQGQITAVYSSSISTSYATGAVTGTGQSTGGLVGLDLGQAITDSYATGAVRGVTNVGGLVGEADFTVFAGDDFTPSITGTTATTTYASGAVDGTGADTGGLVGLNQGSITQASYTPTGAGVTGAAGVGGAVGLNDFGSTITTVSVTAPVSGTSYTGGIVGDNFGSLSTVSFNGSVSGGGGVGGVAGVNEGGASINGALVGQTAATTVSGTADDVGGMAGASFDLAVGGVIDATVSGRDHVGGLVGYNAAQAEGSVTGSVSGRNYVGGLVGLNYGSVGGGPNLYDTAAAAVTGTEYVGGAVGWNDTQGEVEFVNVLSSVAATGDYVGGAVGVSKGEVDSVTAGGTGAVSGAGLAGGLMGLNQGALSGSSSSMAVGGNLYVGGLVGWNDTGATVSTSYATGTVTGVAGAQETVTNNDYVGGLVGVNYGSVANAYATGTVSGVQVVGGLVGTNMAGGTAPDGTSYAGGSVSTAYATGAVSASMGAAGTSFGVQAGAINDVYGFPAFSGQTPESGYVAPAATGNGTDLTPAQEDGSAAYQGFDFTNVWQSQSNGPPTLLPPAEF